jgi:hypothetical protein
MAINVRVTKRARSALKVVLFRAEKFSAGRKRDAA